MKRVRAISAAIGVGLILSSTSLHATAGPKYQIEDMAADANFINDQGTGDGSFGDQNAASPGTVSDLLNVYFTNDAKFLYVNIETTASPPATTGVGYRVRVNPGPGGLHCLNFEAYYPGANNALTAPEAWLIDTCNATETQVEVIPAFGVQIKVPRDANEAFAKGAKLTAPQAQSFLWTGSSRPAGTYTGYSDTTKIGTDWAFVDKKSKKKKK